MSTPTRIRSASTAQLHQPVYRLPGGRDSGSQWQPLDKLNSAQQAIFDKYDAPPYIDSQYAGSIPFLSIGNQYIQISAGFIPDQMQGLTGSRLPRS